MVVNDYKAAEEAANISVKDDNEMTSQMEPMLVSGSSTHRTALTDLVVELAAKAAGFRRSLPEGVLIALADLVRGMNCYYSNLIEGHDTHPVDIERALKNDYSTDPKKRNLQLEAKAHIEVQKWIDAGGLHGRAATVEGLRETHRRFCEQLPDDMSWAEDPDTGERLRMVPGQLRQKYVKVGNHISISPGAVPRFLERFEQAYSNIGKTDTIIAAACAHHRLLWIHPFLDGNGRVVRLMSHSLLLESLDSGSIWSIARGLAHNESAYKKHLMACDTTRRNDFDGRGNLSEEALVEFSRFFLTTCIDQVAFMEDLVQPERLRDRILLWAEEEIRADTLPPKSGIVLEAVLYRGELPRGEVAGILGSSDRQARRVTSALISHEVLASESSRAPLRLVFPVKLATRLMPGLFPAQPD